MIKIKNPMVNISIIGGGGRMGKLIGIELALRGHSIILYDTKSIILDQELNDLFINHTITREKILTNVMICNNLLHSINNSDIVIECIHENLLHKQTILNTISYQCPNHTIIMSNTISLSITDISSKTKDPTKIIGCRFLFPIVHMNKVEITLGAKTSNDTLERTKGFLSQMDYTCVYKSPNKIDIVRLNEYDVISALEVARNPHIIEQQIETDTNEFACPISMMLMSDPVVAMDGHTYDRNSIVTWFETKHTSPMTGLTIDKQLVPNFTLKSLIDSHSVHERK
jgi:3-hydroxyacyl-CoA dehydrogenase